MYYKKNKKIYEKEKKKIIPIINRNDLNRPLLLTEQ